MFRFGLCIASVLALTACAATPEADQTSRGIAAFKDDVRLGESVKSICFARNIDGFRESSRDTVIIIGRRRTEYLVSTQACFQLHNVMSMGLDTRDSCLRRGSVLVVSDQIAPAFGKQQIGLGPDRCLVNEIYEWNEDAKVQDDEGEDSLESSDNPSP